MADDRELTRLAAMAEALRPDWPARSVRALLAKDHRHRAYADLAVAIAVLAVDSATQNLGRLAQPGPWWRVAQNAAGGGETPDVPHVDCPEHPGVRATRCRDCNPPRTPAPAGWRERAMT